MEKVLKRGLYSLVIRKLFPLWFYIKKLSKRIHNSDIRIPVANNNSITAISLIQQRSWYSDTASSFCSYREQDVDIRYIQRMLGHSSISTTEIYTHVSNTKQKDILIHKHPRNLILECEKSLGDMIVFGTSIPLCFNSSVAECLSIDVFCDCQGRPHSIIPRYGLASKDGTTFKCIIEKEKTLINICEQIYNLYCIPGFSNIQFIVRLRNFIFFK